MHKHALSSTTTAYQAMPTPWIGPLDGSPTTPVGAIIYFSRVSSFQNAKFGKVQTGISNFTAEVRNKTPAPKRGVLLLHEGKVKASMETC